MHVIFCGFLFFDQSLCHAYHTGVDISVDIYLADGGSPQVSSRGEAYGGWRGGIWGPTGRHMGARMNTQILVNERPSLANDEPIK